MTWDQLDTFTRQYLETALWSSTDNDDDDTPFDQNYGIEDVSPAFLAQAVIDCDEFRESTAWKAWKAALESGEVEMRDSDTGATDGESIGGHDFWLTRNHHGAGFWDGDYAEPHGTALTAACKAFGELYLWVDAAKQINAE